MNTYGTIVLSKPVLINGVEVTEVTYDTEEIDCTLFAKAEARKIRASETKAGNMAGAVEIDYSLHLYLGFAAIIAVNPSYAFEDLERIKGQSITKISKIGRDFFIRSDGSKVENSDELSETTQEPSIPVLTKSNEKE